MISVSIVEDELRFHVESYNINSERFVAYLKQFVRGEPRSVFMIVDGCPSHCGWQVVVYVQSIQGQVHLHILPGYSPQMNQDKLVWDWLKKKKLAEYAFQNPQKLYQVSLSKPRSLKQLLKRSPVSFLSNMCSTLFNAPVNITWGSS